MTETTYEQVWYCAHCERWGSVCVPGPGQPLTFPLIGPAGDCVLRDHARVSPACEEWFVVGERVGLGFQEQAPRVGEYPTE